MHATHILAALLAASSPATAQIINETAKLTPDVPPNGEQLGHAVAITQNGAVVGAPFADMPGAFDTGTSYLFDSTTGEELTQFGAFDASANDQFGWSIARDGGAYVVGAPRDDPSGNDSGSAYLLFCACAPKIVPLDGQAEDTFGWSVDIDGTTAVIGAPGDDDQGFGVGSAYLFDTATGQQTAKLLANDGAAGVLGWSVGISGGTAIAGATGGLGVGGVQSGTAYLFSTATGQQLARLQPADGGTLDRFGWSVGIDGGLAVVGAPFDDNGSGVDAGAAYVFDVATGQQVFKLAPNDLAAGDQFGYAVAISGTTVVVGSRLDDDNGSSSGSAYVFDEVAPGVWIQSGKLLPSDGGFGAQFGAAVDIHCQSVVVGAPFPHGGGYLFNLSPSTVGTFNGAGVNLDVLTTTPATVGRTWTATVTPQAGRGPGMWNVLLRASTISGPILDLGVFSGIPPAGQSQLLVGGTVLGNFAGPAHAGGGSQSSILIGVPAQCGLIGLPWAAQAVVFGDLPGGAGALDPWLSTAVSGVVGSY